MIQTGHQCLRRQGGDPGSRQLDRERKPIEPGADGGDCGRVRRAQGKAGARGPGAGDEQLNGLGRRQRIDRDIVLAREAEHHPAGGEDRQLLAIGEQIGNPRGGIDHLLQVIEDEQQMARLQIGDQLAIDRQRTLITQAQPAGNSGQDQILIVYRGQIDEPGPVAELPGDLGSDLQGQAGLADAAWAGQRHERYVVAEEESRTAATSCVRPTNGVRGNGSSAVGRYPGQGGRGRGQTKSRRLDW